MMPMKRVFFVEVQVLMRNCRLNGESCNFHRITIWTVINCTYAPVLVSVENPTIRITSKYKKDKTLSIEKTSCVLCRF